MAFRKALVCAFGESVEILALFSKKSLEIRDLYETIEKEEFLSALCLVLDRPAFETSCKALHSLRCSEDCSNLNG